uniref:NAD(P)H dehydrogenase (quinone) n=1 Tax=Aegilops tauschii subsp. strangulata TaxID=200361 RepID=A0A453GPF6_AEGTS
SRQLRTHFIPPWFVAITSRTARPTLQFSENQETSPARMDGSSAEVAKVKRAKTVLTVAAISGSLRRASANAGLIRAAAKMCEESIPGLQIDHVDISDLPLLN